ncbi:MAG TPA: DUF559 domain-containing protein [Solirubrobacteraceae bacterium]|nr:DUF559 domain-containing protein [Solirubrobacteraceae bacterium]
MELDRALGLLADRQHGVVSHAQLLELGFGRDAISWRRRRRTLRAIHRGVYGVGHLALSADAQRLAAVLACGRDALLSHRSAAELWDLTRPAEPPELHVTALARKCRSRPGIEVHRALDFEDGDRTVVRGIPVTTPARTLVDLAGRAASRELERALDEAITLGLLEPADVEAALERYPRRRGTAALRALLADRERPTSLTRSHSEERFLALVRRARLPTPRQNARIDRYTVDFYWPEHRLVVEIDGYRYHSTRSAFERDRAKDLVLRQLGLGVLRFSARQVEREAEACLAATAAALARQERGAA